MEKIEIKLMKYKFSFRQLNWREENLIFSSYQENLDKEILAKALLEISGLPIAGHKEARKVIATLPKPILRRVFVIYKGRSIQEKIFSISNLYKAPEPLDYSKRMQEANSDREEKVDLSLRRMNLDQLEIEKRMARAETDKGFETK